MGLTLLKFRIFGPIGLMGAFLLFMIMRKGWDGLSFYSFCFYSG